MMASATAREALDFALDFLPSTERFLRLQRDDGEGQLAAIAEPMHDDDAEVSRFLVEHAFAALTRASPSKPPRRPAPLCPPQCPLHACQE